MQHPHLQMYAQPYHTNQLCPSRCKERCFMIWSSEDTNKIKIKNCYIPPKNHSLAYCLLVQAKHILIYFQQHSNNRSPKKHFSSVMALRFQPLTYLTHAIRFNIWAEQKDIGISKPTAATMLPCAVNNNMPEHEGATDMVKPSLADGIPLKCSFEHWFLVGLWLWRKNKRGSKILLYMTLR
jgi:hypothetical protein